MAFREVRVFEVKEALRLWTRERGLRAIARDTSLNRKTVRRYVEAAIALGLTRSDEQMALDDHFVAQVIEAVRPGSTTTVGLMRHHCRRHRELIEGWLDEGATGPKIIKLLHRQTGVWVPLRTLQRFTHDELRPTSKGSTVRVAEGKPGDVLEVDFLKMGTYLEQKTGKKRTLYALLCLAPYSRHMFVWPCHSQRQSVVIDGLEAAWRFFGGVFNVLLPDNMSTVVSKTDPISPVFSGPFLEYAQSRGFVIDPARPAHPKDKARVERQVRYVRDNFFAGERFGSLEEAREAAQRWCREEAATRVHGTTKQQPGDVFEREERPLLLPMPMAPYDQPRWATVTVGLDHTVVIDGAMYSVPHQIAPGELRARLDRAALKLYLNERLIKIHPRQPTGSAHIDPIDLPPKQRALATRSGESIARKAETMGPHVGTYARRLLDDPRPWIKMRALYRLLGLGRRYGHDALDEACARALELDVVDVKRISNILNNGLIQRRLLKTPPPPPPRKDNVIPISRFARDPSEWRLPPEDTNAPT